MVHPYSIVSSVEESTITQAKSIIVTNFFFLVCVLAMDGRYSVTGRYTNWYQFSCYLTEFLALAFRFLLEYWAKEIGNECVCPFILRTTQSSSFLLEPL